MIETDESHFAMSTILSQKFEPSTIHPCSFISGKVSLAKFNYIVSDKEILAILYTLRKRGHFVQGTEHKVVVFSDHQNLSYYSTQNVLNRQHPRRAETVQEFHLVILSRKGSAIHKADIWSRSLAYISGVGGTIAVMVRQLWGPDQWLEIGAMEINTKVYEQIKIPARIVSTSLLEPNAKITSDKVPDDEYKNICQPITMGERIDEHYEIWDELLRWKGRPYAPLGSTKQI